MSENGLLTDAQVATFEACYAAFLDNTRLFAFTRVANLTAIVSVLVGDLDPTTLPDPIESLREWTEPTVLSGGLFTVSKHPLVSPLVSNFGFMASLTFLTDLNRYGWTHTLGWLLCPLLSLAAYFLDVYVIFEALLYILIGVRSWRQARVKIMATLHLLVSLYRMCNGVYSGWMFHMILYFAVALSATHLVAGSPRPRVFDSSATTITFLGTLVLASIFANNVDSFVENKQYAILAWMCFPFVCGVPFALIYGHRGINSEGVHGGVVPYVVCVCVMVTSVLGTTFEKEIFPPVLRSTPVRDTQLRFMFGMLRVLIVCVPLYKLYKSLRTPSTSTDCRLWRYVMFCLLILVFSLVVEMTLLKKLVRTSSITYCTYVLYTQCITTRCIWYFCVPSYADDGLRAWFGSLRCVFDTCLRLFGVYWEVRLYWYVHMFNLIGVFINLFKSTGSVTVHSTQDHRTNTPFIQEVMDQSQWGTAVDEAQPLEAQPLEAPRLEAPRLEAPRLEAPRLEAPRLEALLLKAPPPKAPPPKAPPPKAPPPKAPPPKAPPPKAPPPEAPPTRATRKRRAPDDPPERTAPKRSCKQRSCKKPRTSVPKAKGRAKRRT